MPVFQPLSQKKKKKEAFQHLSIGVKAGLQIKLLDLNYILYIFINLWIRANKKNIYVKHIS